MAVSTDWVIFIIYFLLNNLTKFVVGVFLETTRESKAGAEQKDVLNFS